MVDPYNIDENEEGVDSICYFSLDNDLETMFERYTGPELDETKLCERCEHLNFEKMFTPASVGNLREKVVPESEFLIDMAILHSSCTLCRLLGTLTPGLEHYFLCERPEGYREDIVMMSSPVTPGAGCVALDPATKWRRITTSRGLPEKHVLSDQIWPEDARLVDLNVLKEKLDQCKAEHEDFCDARERGSIEHLRVFNCETRECEDATDDTKYVALSYVWGSTIFDGKRLPQTISDALHVTLQLGFKYIWVDQLCIDQDSSHKMGQIQQMHSIYRNSELTIIAAAGNNSDYGIPGTPWTPRMPRICCKFGDLLFLEKKIDPEVRLARATWASRAWTFQEEVMSKRVIVFTDREAWFSCALIVPLHGREYKDLENRPHNQPGWSLQDEDDVKTGLLLPHGRADHPRIPTDSAGFGNLVQAYSRLNLSFNDDVINAFSGILGAFEQANPPVYHFWGSPIFTSSRGHDSGEDERANIAKQSLDGFIRGLCFQKNISIWYNETDAALTRRPGFPSWSWTGWSGPISFDWLHWTYQTSHKNTGISVVVELVDGTTLSWLEFEDRSYLKREPRLMSRFIRLRAWTISVQPKQHKGEYDDKPCLYTVISTSNGERFIRLTLVDQEYERSVGQEADFPHAKTYTGVLLSSFEDLIPRSNGFAYFMLVETRIDPAERVGYFQIRSRSFWRHYNGPSPDLNIPSQSEIYLNGLRLQWQEVRLG